MMPERGAAAAPTTAEQAIGAWDASSDLSEQLHRHLDAIAALAFDHEPDWEAVYEGADHDWCGQTSAAVAAYLRQQGIAAQAVRGGLRGNAHAWVILPDATIIDATIAQYVEHASTRAIAVEEVPWQESDLGDLVAVIDPAHPLHADYAAA